MGNCQGEVWGQTCCGCRHIVHCRGPGGQQVRSDKVRQLAVSDWQVQLLKRLHFSYPGSRINVVPLQLTCSIA